MAPRPPATAAPGRARAFVLAALVVLGGAFVSALVHDSASSSAYAPATTLPSDLAPSVTGLESTHPTPAELPPLADPVRGSGQTTTRLGIQDGLVSDGVTVFDDGYPAVTNLDAALLTALRRAATDARRDGVTIYVNSGWRSAAYQERLLQQAVSKYGSAREASRWVATPATSLHVSGDAVDIGRSGAASWLSRHGARYGLCRTYANEPWHYELRSDAVQHGCPRQYADPTHDPRMQP